MSLNEKSHDADSSVLQSVNTYRTETYKKHIDSVITSMFADYSIKLIEIVSGMKR